MKEINKRIRKYRQILGMSQRELAERLGKKSSTYSQLERNGNFTCDTLIKLSEIFKVNAAVLLYGVDYADPLPPIPPPPPPPIFPELSKKEINIIKIIRNLSPKDQKEILKFIEVKYKKSKFR